MCGFTAIVGSKTFLKEAIESMAYRGLPGHTSEYHQGYIHIAHQRLPIVDLTSNGDQPARIGNHIGFLVGEVFNFRRVSHQDTDTKAALDVFLSKGLQGFHDFDGFWSFVTVMDSKLFAATDYLGQKPIYYRTDMKALASEPVALKEYGFTTYDPIFFSNIKKWGYDMTGRTPWAEIRQLPPGHYWYDGNIKPYWNWNSVRSIGVRQSIIEATQNRLLGDQPVTCLLSGGLDSSIVYLLAKQLGSQIKSYHVENEEAEFARLVDPNTTCLKLDNVSYQEAIEWNQSPVDLGSVHPQAVLANSLAKEGYHVCLTGDGADELFGGYERNKKYDSQMSDVFMELPYYHLPRLDRIMMRKTIELRTPFLAPEVIKAAMATSYSDRENKRCLKEAFKDILPTEILNREKKALKTLRIKNGGLKQIEDNINLFKGIY